MTNGDESYAIDLCDRVLRLKAKRQHRFDFLRRDSGRKPPVDAYCEIGADRKLVVMEYRKMQHREAVAFLTKAWRAAVLRGRTLVGMSLG